MCGNTNSASSASCRWLFHSTEFGIPYITFFLHSRVTVKGRRCLSVFGEAVCLPSRSPAMILQPCDGGITTPTEMCTCLSSGIPSRQNIPDNCSGITCAFRILRKRISFFSLSFLFKSRDHDGQKNPEHAAHLTAVPWRRRSDFETALNVNTFFF